MRHAVAAGDPEAAADLIWLFAPEYVTHGRGETIARWCALLSAEELAAHPQAALGAGWAALEAGDAEHAAHCAALALSGDSEPRHAGWLDARGDGAAPARRRWGFRAQERSAEDAARSDAGMPADSPLRALSLYLLGTFAMLDDDHERAREALDAAEPRAAGHLPTAYGLILAQQALLAIEADRWLEAEALMSRATAQQHAAGIEGYASQGIVPAMHALVLANGGALEAARPKADQATRSLTLLRFMIPWLALETRLVLACAYAKLGDGSRAQTLLTEARELSDSESGPLLARWMARVEDEIERAGTDVSRRRGPDDRRAAHASVPADAPVAARDRRAPLHHAEHRQDAHDVALSQARRHLALRGGRPQPRARAPRVTERGRAAAARRARPGGLLAGRRSRPATMTAVVAVPHDA